MEWTKQTPTGKGWYLNYCKGDYEFLKICTDPYGKLTVGHYGSIESYYLIAQNGEYWMGPLQMPEPPKDITK